MIFYNGFNLLIDMLIIAIAFYLASKHGEQQYCNGYSDCIQDIADGGRVETKYTEDGFRISTMLRADYSEYEENLR